MLTVDFSGMSFSPEEVRNIDELLYDRFLNTPSLSSLCGMKTGIVYKTEVGYVGSMGLVGKAETTCATPSQDADLPIRKQLWDPVRWEIKLQLCAFNYKDTMVEYSINLGVDRNDLTNKAFIVMVADKLGEAIERMIFRFVWFGNKTINSGGLTAGTDVDYFNLIDGFWKQIESQVTANPAQRVVIPANAQATTELQRSKLDEMTDVEVKALFARIKTRAPITLRGQGSTPRFYVTQSIFDRFTQALENTLVHLAYTDLIEGFTALKYNGMEIVAVPMWDQMIESYFNDGTKLENPHRIIFAEQSNIIVGTPSTEVLSYVKVFYDPKDEIVHLRAKDAIDAKLGDPTLFVAAY